jgi:hypothetical protein
MSLNSPDNDPRDHRDSATYWFAVLEIARERGDFERAAEAQRQLRRLGVCVNYERPVRQPAGGGGCCGC